MKTILITGGLGQIGTELSTYLRRAYGTNHVIVTDVVRKDSPVVEEGPFEQLDVTDGKRLAELVDRYHVDTVMHLAALLSAVAEAHPQAAYHINLDGLFQVLEVAREKKLAVFTPSSIGAFGASTPKVTPQDTIQRPSTMYGVTKVAGELLCDYYFRRFGVDTRGVRFPGLISYAALPGGGTTDYAVDIYYAALKTGHYDCPIAAGTLMDMMYIPDALRAVHELMEADPTRLTHRNAFNIAAMSFAPEDIAAAIQKELPSFTMSYQVNPILQAIADSWPDKLDDTAAREEWGWKAQYDLKTMTKDMLQNLRPRLVETK